MIRTEIARLALEQSKKYPTPSELDLAMIAVKFEREHILRHIRNTAKGVDAGVAKPDLWALAQYIEKTLL
jgi:hypothetical protein